MKINKNQIKSTALDNLADNGDGSYSITFSSETAGLRPYGNEIVKHDPGSVNLEHASGGLSLLFNHDINQLIGRAENIRIDPMTKQGKADIRFFSTPDAQNIEQKVMEGAGFVSYRYSIDDFAVVKSERKDEPPTVYITKSTPKEISIVSVPFDFTVGVNRSDEMEELLDIPSDGSKGEAEPELVAEKELLDTEDDNKALEVPKLEEIDVVKTEQTIFIKDNKTMSLERNEILALGAFAEKMGVAKEYSELAGTDKTTDEIKSALVDVLNAKSVPVSTANVSDGHEVAKSFSIAKAMTASITGDWSKAPFEKEVQRQWESKQPNYAGGLIIPHEALKAGSAMSTQTSGAPFVFPTYAGFVEMLRPACIAIANGANVIGGLSMNYQYVQENAAPAYSWIAENPGVDVAASVDGLQTKTLSPKQLLGQIQFTRTQLAQSPVAFDQFLTSKLIREFGIAIDCAAFGSYVSGGALTPLAGAPTGGVLLDAGVPTVAIGVNGGSASTNQKSVLQLKTLVNVNNALNGFNPIFVTNPNIQGVLESIVPPGLTYAAAPYWQNGTLSGYKAVSTNNIPGGNITKGTANNCHAMFFGDLSQLSIGVFGDIVVNLDPYTLMGQGAFRVVANQLVDCGLIRPLAFAKITDMQAS